MEQSLPFKLFANCVCVKGANRTAICDLQKQELKLIPNDLFEIIDENEGKSIADIKADFDSGSHEVIDDYFQFLLDNQLIFFTRHPDLFPKLGLSWFNPFECTHALLDLDQSSGYSLHEAIGQLSGLNCKFIQVRFFRETGLAELTEIALYAGSPESMIVSLEFVLPANRSLTEKTLQKFLLDHPRVTSLKIYAADRDHFSAPVFDTTGFIIWSVRNYKSSTHCGEINSDYFSINISAFTESVGHNSCLNGKISIDAKGYIRNCPSMAKSFGHINDLPLKEALQQSDFKKLWSVSKDHVSVCRDCEFRYICTDCRAYVEDPADELSKPLKCGYDPYTNKWEKWSENPMKQKAIQFYNSTV